MGAEQPIPIKKCNKIYMGCINLEVDATQINFIVKSPSEQSTPIKTVFKVIAEASITTEVEKEDLRPPTFDSVANDVELAVTDEAFEALLGGTPNQNENEKDLSLSIESADFQDAESQFADNFSSEGDASVDEPLSSRPLHAEIAKHCDFDLPSDYMKNEEVAKTKPINRIFVRAPGNRFDSLFAHMGYRIATNSEEDVFEDLVAADPYKHL